MLNKRVIPPVVLALALAAPGTAFAEPASSYVEESAPAAASQDLRSPDGRDAASGVVSSSLAGTTESQDLRSPDVRDVANGNVPAEAVPTVTVTRDDGFEWLSAGIGAAVMLAIVLALAAAAALVVPRRRPRTPLAH